MNGKKMFVRNNNLMKLYVYPYIYTAGDSGYRSFVMQPYSRKLVEEWFEDGAPTSHINPVIMDDYISECYRMKYPLYWKEKILEKFPYSKISSSQGSAEYYQETLKELEKPLPIYPMEYNELIAQGYQSGAPSIEAYNIDKKRCDDAICGNCSNKGLIHFPMTDPAKRYKAFAICPVCRNEQEI